MVTLARLPLLLVLLLLPACGGATSAARGPESAPATVSLPPSAPEPASPEPEGPDAPRPPAPVKDELPATFGRTKEDAINVCQPRGQVVYLSRLRCPDGQPPRFGRHGNVGARNPRSADDTPEDMIRQMNMSRRLDPGEVDHHVIDLYVVECSDQSHEIFMDMYHCADPRPNKPPSGFTITPEE